MLFLLLFLEALVVVGIVIVVTRLDDIECELERIKQQLPVPAPTGGFVSFAEKDEL